MQSKDFAWFVENMPLLFAEYGSVFASIKNQKVIGIYKTYAEAVKETQKKEALGTFIVQQCGTDESAYTDYISSLTFA